MTERLVPLHGSAHGDAEFSLDRLLTDKLIK